MTAAFCIGNSLRKKIMKIDTDGVKWKLIFLTIPFVKISSKFWRTKKTEMRQLLLYSICSKIVVNSNIYFIIFFEVNEISQIVHLNFNEKQNQYKNNWTLINWPKDDCIWRFQTLAFKVFVMKTVKVKIILDVHLKIICHFQK